MNGNAGASAPGDGETSVELLAVEARRRLGVPPKPAGWPAVSVVVVNRDGISHLRCLQAGLSERTDYRDFELIVVDNDSSDESVAFLRQVEAPFPISVVTNQHNESFSDACNQGADLARAELLLFLNNDIEPFEPGWLRELVHCLQSTAAGLAGATLLCPAEHSDWGYRVQHRAIRIADQDGLLGPDRSSYGAEPFDEEFGKDADTPVAAGACMLVARDLFQQFGGFTHGFFYGAEDIDLGLKVLAEGARVICCGRSLLIHRLGSTRTKESVERRLTSGESNRRLLWERWGPRMRREYELDRLEGGGFWAAPNPEAAAKPPTREEVLALGFCLKSSEPAPKGDPFPDLRSELISRGHRCTILRGENVNDLTGLNFDIAVHLRGPERYLPKPGQLNVLWAHSQPDALNRDECRHYDLVITTSAASASDLRGGDLDIPNLVAEDLRPEALATLLVEAVEARMRDLDYPLRIGPQPTGDAT